MPIVSLYLPLDDSAVKGVIMDGMVSCMKEGIQTVCGNLTLLFRCVFIGNSFWYHLQR